MSKYTYDQFEKALKESGFKWTDADLALAKANPDVGMSLLQYGKDYSSATTSDAKALAHKGAEALRKKYGQYSAGADGSKFYVAGDAAPTYVDKYADKKKELMDAILNRPAYSYDAEKDPVAQAYQKQYAREGNRATDHTMASAAAATGGVPSSYAMSAAAQAGNQYAAKMADKIPELEQQAYDRYRQDLGLKLSDLEMVENASKNDYNQFLNELNQFNNDRNFEYASGQDKLDREYQTNKDKTDRDLKMALLKAEYGDYSGLKALGVDTSKLEAAEAAKASAGSGGGSGRGYSSAGGGYESSSNSGAGGGSMFSTGELDALMQKYPDAWLPPEEWGALAQKYGADTLREIGFRIKPTKPAKRPGSGTIMQMK